MSSLSRRVVVNNEKADHPSPRKLGEKVSAEGYISYDLHQVVHTGFGDSYWTLLLHVLTFVPEHWLSPTTTAKGNLPVQMLQVTFGGLSSLLNTQEGRVDTGRNSGGQNHAPSMWLASSAFRDLCGLKHSSLWNCLWVTATVQTGRTTSAIRFPVAEGRLVGWCFHSGSPTPHPLLSHLSKVWRKLYGNKANHTTAGRCLSSWWFLMFWNLA